MNLDQLELLLEEKISDGKTNPIGYGGGSLAGVSLQDANVMRSPCAALRWMADNSDYIYETFVTLSDTQGWQGINIYNKDGSLHRQIKVPMGGGENADPMKTIYANNKKIVLETLIFISQNA